MRIKYFSLRGSLVALALLFAVLAAAQKSYTYPQYLSKAKALGYRADNCSFCHRSPQGGTGWNDRGQWLIGEKKKRHADSVDVRWLKDYKPVASAARDEENGPGSRTASTQRPDGRAGAASEGRATWSDPRQTRSPRLPSSAR